MRNDNDYEEDEFALYYSDEELYKMLEKLNGLTSKYSPWRSTNARKHHEDLFGVDIQPRETYYKRKVGAAWDSVIKLSRRSMVRLLYTFFAGNHDLEAFAEYMHEERIKELRKLHNRSRFIPDDDDLEE